MTTYTNTLKVLQQFIYFFVNKHHLSGTHCKGVLDGGDEFQNSNDVYEAIGEVLHDVAANKGEDEIR